MRVDSETRAIFSWNDQPKTIAYRAINYFQRSGHVDPRDRVSLVG